MSKKNQELHDKIEKLLNDKHITQHKIAMETGVTQQMISKLKTKKQKIDNISLGNAELLADLYDNISKINK